MSNPSYSLEVISHHPQFKNKSLRKYYVDGIETVGAWGDEPFEIKFTNHTWQKIQVKISLDGTDVFTGAPATTEATKDMWVVQGFGTLSLKAWPETNNGGAAFIFTSANNSVAVHTHGDLSSRGIVAAAVYTEGHVEPVRIQQDPVHHYHHYNPYGGYIWNNQPWTTAYPIYGGGTVGSSINVFNNSSNGTLGGGGTHSTNSIMPAADSGKARRRSKSLESVDGDQTLGELESLVSVGAGQHVDQKITYVTGLIKPTFSETVRVKYLWWDDLVAKLKENNVPAPQPSGFPGDKKQANINLGSTPRQGVVHRTEQTFVPMYARV
jgi:hypothetical protein